MHRSVVAGAGAFFVALVSTWLLAPVLGELVASPFFDDLAETMLMLSGRPRPHPLPSAPVRVG